MKNQDFAAKDRQKLTGYREPNYKGIKVLALLLCLVAVAYGTAAYWVLK